MVTEVIVMHCATKLLPLNDLSIESTAIVSPLYPINQTSKSVAIKSALRNTKRWQSFTFPTILRTPHEKA